MGLDTRAYKRATTEWQQQWVKETNERGERPVMFGLAMETLTELVTLDDAPSFHQDFEAEWPGGLVGGLVSACGNAPSFRGKAYTGYVEHVTGRSLYEAAETMWEDEVLAEVADKLAAAVDTATEAPADFDGDPSWWPDRDERAALAAWFAVCVEHDLVVGGDY